MEYLYLRRNNDKQQILIFIDGLEKLSDTTLVEQYNRVVNIGVVGVHLQALHLLAMRTVFLRRFDKSPITFKDNCVLGLSGKVFLTEYGIN